MFGGRGARSTFAGWVRIDHARPNPVSAVLRLFSIASVRRRWHRRADVRAYACVVFGRAVQRACMMSESAIRRRFTGVLMTARTLILCLGEQ